MRIVYIEIRRYEVEIMVVLVWVTCFIRDPDVELSMFDPDIESYWEDFGCTVDLVELSSLASEFHSLLLELLDD